MRLDDAYRDHQAVIRAIGYRMTGSTADAADIVQDTFERLVSRGPRDGDPLPWLVRVATNLSRDRYRARKRRPYVGPWLPALIEGEPDLALNQEARYGAAESVRLAFLVALEALGPTERAVLVLRDVLDYSAREAGDALGISEANTRTVHLRARRKMAAYDRGRAQAEPAEVDAVIGRFMWALGAGDVAGVEALLASDVLAASDAGGKHRAATRIVRGPQAVAKLLVGILRKHGGHAQEVAIRTVNGQRAVVFDVAPVNERFAPRVIVVLDVDPEGRIRAIWSVLAPGKLV